MLKTMNGKQIKKEPIIIIPRTRVADLKRKRIAFSADEAAAMLGVSVRFIRERLATKEIVSFRLGGRVLISTEEIKRLTVEGCG